MTGCIYCRGRLRKVCSLKNSRIIPSTVVECMRCGLIYKHPVPSEEELERIYNLPQYAQEAYFYFDPNQDLPQVRMWRFILRSGHKSLLDIGCGDGKFLDLAQKAGKETYGIELSKDLRARICSGHMIYGKRISAISKDDFDMITFLDLIEHLRQPLEETKDMRDKMREGGHLVIFTPDMDSLPVRLLMLLKSITGIDLLKGFVFEGFHLFFFRKRTLKRYLRKMGFAIVHESSWPMLMRDNEAKGMDKLFIRALDLFSRLFGSQYRMLLVLKKVKTRS